VQVGLVISVLMHAALLGWALFTIQTQRDTRVQEPDPIITGLVSESDLTRLKQGARTAKQLQADNKESPKADPARKEAAKPKPVAAAPAPPPAPEPKADPIAEKLAAPPPPPPPAAEEENKRREAMLKEQARQAQEKAKAEELQRAEEARLAEAQRQAEERRKAEEKRQAEAKRKADEEKRRREAQLKRKQDEEKRRREAEAARQKQFDAAKIAALLNKVPDKGAPAPSAPPTEQTKAKGPTLGAPEGRDQQISSSEIAQLKGIINSRLRSCWRLPSGGGGSDTPVVTLRWTLNPDGTLERQPEVESPRGDTLFRLAAEAAIRAVQQCAPFPLPRDKYAHWKTITWEFDPSQMM
jgi:colicin import membrane protein